MKLLPSRRILCTPCNHAPCHFMQSHIRKVYACLAVTCHLHFWQNDQGLLRATAVTRGWNRHRNKSQHRKLNLEKKILLPLLPRFEPATFRSQVRRSNHWAIPAPNELSLLINGITHQCLAQFINIINVLGNPSTLSMSCTTHQWYYSSMSCTIYQHHQCLG